MHKKTVSRLRRARRARMHMRNLGAHRLSVHRTPKHIYAQIVSPDGGRTLVAASTNERDLRGQLSGHGGNKDAAQFIGRTIAERAKAAGIQEVAFDRSGFAYHGRIKALADAARDNGLQF
ncbi:50S ribosomal protein L18 [Salinisphaera sp. SPP-AMP-43]|uniref:50S ribosomal protein L18 n=1 Tax=Salinisphaera sp. SPP-AMP-43 TaxID=3121288 RepID=UPI003C6E3C4E